MYVGHYAVSFALKRFEPRVSLGMLFLAVQFVDILFFPLVLLGIEHLNIQENFTEATHFELEYMPFSHSLAASLFWAAAAFVIFRWVIVKSRSVALVMAIAVFSHWLLDLIVHTPDLPLWFGDSTKLGFGLWNNAVATYVVEAGFLLAALWLYLRSSDSSTGRGKTGAVSLVALLLLVNAWNIFGPLQGDSETGLAIMVLMSYFLFAALAFFVDRKRTAYGFSRQG